MKSRVAGVLIFAAGALFIARDAQGAEVNACVKNKTGRLTKLTIDTAPPPSCKPNDQTPVTIGGGGPAPMDMRFSVMWQRADGTVDYVVVRDDGSIRATDDPGVVVTHVATGKWCISTTTVGAEGAMGTLQNNVLGGPGTILVTMSQSPSTCDGVPGVSSRQIAVETFGF